MGRHLVAERDHAPVITFENAEARALEPNGIQRARRRGHRGRRAVSKTTRPVAEMADADRDSDQMRTTDLAAAGINPAEEAGR
jgi:hypothetical protein